MENEILRQLHNLRSITPDPAFSARSRSLILEKTKPPFFAWPVLAYAGVFAVILVVSFSIITLFQARTPSLSLSSLNTTNLDQELKNLGINFQLEELSYQQAVNQTIASALGEISDNQIGHLNPSLLEAEKENAELETFSNPQIEKLLNEVLF